MGRPTVVDLSHPIRAGMVTYPGLPAPVITPFMTRVQSRETYAPGTEFTIDFITMVGNTGTYLDAPWHRHAEGADLAGLDLATLVGLPAVVVDVTDFGVGDHDHRGIGPEVFAGRSVRGAAVLLHTGWSALFGTPAYADLAPYLREDATRHLVDAGAVLVGIESVNIDDIEADAGGRRPTHTLLLAAGVHVVEHLTNLAALPADGARFTAVPPAVEGLGTFPVRAFAELPH